MQPAGCLSAVDVLLQLRFKSSALPAAIPMSPAGVILVRGYSGRAGNNENTEQKEHGTLAEHLSIGGLDLWGLRADIRIP